MEEYKLGTILFLGAICLFVGLYLSLNNTLRSSILPTLAGVTLILVGVSLGDLKTISVNLSNASLALELEKPPPEKVAKGLSEPSEKSNERELETAVGK